MSTVCITMHQFEAALTSPALLSPTSFPASDLTATKNPYLWLPRYICITTTAKIHTGVCVVFFPGNPKEKKRNILVFIF